LRPALAHSFLTLQERRRESLQVSRSHGREVAIGAVLYVRTDRPKKLPAAGLAQFNFQLRIIGHDLRRRPFGLALYAFISHVEPADYGHSKKHEVVIGGSHRD
jgi:hypothetical protein